MLQVGSVISGPTGCGGFLTWTTYPPHLAESSSRYFCVDRDRRCSASPSNRRNGSRIVSSNAKSTSVYSGSPARVNHSALRRVDCERGHQSCTGLQLQQQTLRPTLVLGSITLPFILGVNVSPLVPFPPLAAGPSVRHTVQFEDLTTDQPPQSIVNRGHLLVGDVALSFGVFGCKTSHYRTETSKPDLEGKQANGNYCLQVPR